MYFKNLYDERIEPNSDFLVQHSYFSNLTGVSRGGAIYNDANININVEECLFTFCSCTDRGGAIYANQGEFFIQKSCFIKNSANLNSDFQCSPKNNIESEITVVFGTTILHSLWNSGTESLYIKNLNSSYAKLENSILYYGVLLTVKAPFNHSIKFLQCSNSTGNKALFSSEYTVTTKIDHVNLINNENSNYN